MPALSLSRWLCALTLAKVVPGFATRWALDVVAGGGLRGLRGDGLRGLAPAAAARGGHGARRSPRLSDRLTSALSFAAVPTAAHAAHGGGDGRRLRARGELSPRKAMPIAVPRDLARRARALAGVALIALIQVRTSRAGRTRPRPSIRSCFRPTTSISFARSAKSSPRPTRTPKCWPRWQAYNQLVEDLAQKRLDRTEAFRRMHEIESRLMEGRALDAKALDEELKMRASALKKSELLEAPGRSARESTISRRPRKQMRDLAKRLREQARRAGKRRELERLRDAMKKAAEGQKERMAALEQRREELREQLLIKSSKTATPGRGRGAEPAAAQRARARAARSRARERESARGGSSTGSIAISPRPPRTS